jgi:hypothetical protein
LKASSAATSAFGCCGRDLQPPEAQRGQLLADR